MLENIVLPELILDALILAAVPRSRARKPLSKKKHLRRYNSPSRTTHLGVIGRHRDPGRQHHEDGVDVAPLCGQVQRRLPVRIALVAVRPRLLYGQKSVGDTRT